MNQKEMIERIEALETQVKALQEKVDGIRVRDRGPRSTRAMSRLDAWRVLHGDLKNMGHKEAAKALGLSYGQVYSARGTYTFKDVKPDEYTLEDVAKEAAAEA